MNAIAVIYWSQTGNTKTMAEEIVKGIESAGAKADLYEVSAISAGKAAEYEKLALGCPAMGDEVLEESEFAPFYEELEPQIGGKKVALFGSYGWGDGQWMRDWEQRAKDAGIQIVNGQGLIANESPDDEAVQACQALGAGLAKA